MEFPTFVRGISHSAPRHVNTHAANSLPEPKTQLTRLARATRILTTSFFHGEDVMPQYKYFCRACQKEFSKILTISEREKVKIACPHCKSKDVEQRWAAFYAVTSKKS